MSGPWRTPAAATEDYPGLTVSDNCVSGSINLSKSRLSLWAFVWVAVVKGWDAVEKGWGPTKHYGFTADDLGGFLNCLLEQRGEFGRLICVLADVERHDAESEDIDSFKAWWDRPEERNRVADQLRRCLAVLETDSADGGAQGGAPE